MVGQPLKYHMRNSGEELHCVLPPYPRQWWGSVVPTPQIEFQLGDVGSFICGLWSMVDMANWLLNPACEIWRARDSSLAAEEEGTVVGPASTPSVCQDKGEHALNPWTKCGRHPESTGVSPLRSGFQWAGGLSTRSWRWITGFLEARGQRVKNNTGHVGQAHANQASFQHYSGPESAEPALIKSREIFLFPSLTSPLQQLQSNFEWRGIRNFNWGMELDVPVWMYFTS